MCRFIKSTHGTNAYGIKGNDTVMAEKKSGVGMQVWPTPGGAKMVSGVVLSWMEMAGLLYHHSHQALVVGPSGNDHDLGLGSLL